MAKDHLHCGLHISQVGLVCVDLSLPRPRGRHGWQAWRGGLAAAAVRVSTASGATSAAALPPAVLILLDPLGGPSEGRIIGFLPQIRP